MVNVFTRKYDASTKVPRNRVDYISKLTFHCRIRLLTDNFSYGYGFLLCNRHDFCVQRYWNPACGFSFSPSKSYIKQTNRFQWWDRRCVITNATVCVMTFKRQMVHWRPITCSDFMDHVKFQILINETVLLRGNGHMTQVLCKQALYLYKAVFSSMMCITSFFCVIYSKMLLD